MTPLAATYAADKLARLARCAERGIKPVRPGDEDYQCANDGVTLVGSPLAHDPSEVERLRRAAGPLLARVGRVP